MCVNYLVSRCNHHPLYVSFLGQLDAFDVTSSPSKHGLLIPQKTYQSVTPAVGWFKSRVSGLAFEARLDNRSDPRVFDYTDLTTITPYDGAQPAAWAAPCPAALPQRTPAPFWWRCPHPAVAAAKEPASGQPCPCSHRRDRLSCISMFHRLSTSRAARCSAGFFISTAFVTLQQRRGRCSLLTPLSAGGGGGGGGNGALNSSSSSSSSSSDLSVSVHSADINASMVAVNQTYSLSNGLCSAARPGGCTAGSLSTYGLETGACVPSANPSHKFVGPPWAERILHALSRSQGPLPQPVALRSAPPKPTPASSAVSASVSQRQPASASISHDQPASASVS